MVMLILRKNRKEAYNLSASPSFESIHGGGKEISMLEKKVPRMSHTDLKDATNNFSENNVIGQGEIGMMYKAALPSGYLFAVQKLHNCRILEEHFVMTDSSNSLLNEWISHLLTGSKIYDAIDKSLVGQGFDDEIFQLLKVGCHCVDSIPDRRPTMLQVYKDIRAMRERCGQIDDSEILVQHHEIYPPCSKGKSVEIEKQDKFRQLYHVLV
ncbi:hypothetical protein POTOM_054431 [Populus tomentosa]|uniref:Uncharacterized protein n=1 Tax=Populus tomentosa TaxID=118781 RepID=A0A8X8C357_POPTO|nr:hypothetical protein POTOM_054431 [Populus tomentosa]